MVIFQVKNSAILTFLLILFSGSLFSQTTKIMGLVTEASTGRPMPYVTVSMVGTTAVTKTNNQGKFELAGPSDATKAQFNYIGYKTLTLNIKPGNDP